MADTKPNLQDTADTALDIRLPDHSPSPTHDLNESAAHHMGIRSADPFSTAYDLSQSADVTGRFDDSNKMYICHLCDFRTAFRNSLLNHQAVHSDFRPWVCAVCEYAAKRKQDLKKHLHTIHGLMVESTMLKPVGLPRTNLSGSLSRGESGEDNSWDDTKANKMSDMDSIHNNSHFLQPMSEMSLNMPGSHPSGSTDLLTVSIKQEKLEPAGQKPLPSMSNFISRSPSESDCDLPVSFPPTVVSSKDGMAGLPQNSAKSSESLLRLNRIYNTITEKSKSTKDSKLPLVHSKHPSDGDFLSQSFSSSTRKRPRNYPQDSQTFLDTSQEYSAQPLIKSGKNVHADDLPCSSSMDVSHSRGNQTQTCFMCEFCDIMFFQRAMYLMHAGLHSPDNPWCCAVCGNSFTEKYSFTSHFINQH